MQRSIKLDFSDKPKFEKTPEGFLRAEATLAKAGVFPYSYGEGSSVQEAKLPEDILSKETVDSAEGVPVTNGHPMENGEYILVNSGNAKDYAVGNISKPKVDGDSIKSIITIWDAKTISDIEAGRKQLSIGSACQEDPNSGEYDGKKFDVSQKNIRINHVAIVDVGRAGGDVKIHVDRGDLMFKYTKFDGTILDISERPILDELIALNKTIKDNSLKIKADGDVIAELQKKISENKTADPADIQKIQGLLDTANQAVTEWQKKYGALESAMPDMVDAAAAEKVAVTETAKSADPEMKTDGMNTRDIKMQIIQKTIPFPAGTKMDSIHPEVINARYDASVELLREKAKLKPSQDKTAFSSKVDAAEIEKNKNAVRNAFYGTQEKK